MDRPGYSFDKGFFDRLPGNSGRPLAEAVEEGLIGVEPSSVVSAVESIIYESRRHSGPLRAAVLETGLRQMGECLIQATEIDMPKHGGVEGSD